ncbi:globin [Solwaraspora sp. WMMD406]|uniref:globin n=1 Tax=Solwaraspora sp. WMMD406 TaxID=3016095 RepID=UPI002417A341|nr:globin [Solwaraspora sp. WMMD406]MDG4764564.1 globin [Solwaraspora sp. WMMD406]
MTVPDPASGTSGTSGTTSGGTGGTPTPAADDPAAFFVALGGEPTFRRLVGEFYAGVATDRLLRPMYPEEDLGPAADRLALFLMQYWGGPGTYSQQRGHPRLRMRHAPYRIGAAERDAWLTHMRRAVDSLGLHPELAGLLWDYLERAAYFMVNDMTPTAPPGRDLPVRD